VVEVHRDRNIGRGGHRARSGQDRLHATVMEADRVLADLQDDRGADALCRLGDRLGMLESDHVEGRQPGAVTVGGADEFCGGDQRHQAEPFRISGPSAGIRT
jgi:hypothetical protein